MDKVYGKINVKIQKEKRKIKDKMNLFANREVNYVLGEFTGRRV